MANCKNVNNRLGSLQMKSQSNVVITKQSARKDFLQEELGRTKVNHHFKWKSMDSILPRLPFQSPLNFDGLT